MDMEYDCDMKIVYSFMINAFNIFPYLGNCSTDISKS